MKKLTLLIGCSFFLMHCSLPQKEAVVTQQGYEELSMEELQQSLGVDLDDLGFVQKTFNSCSLEKPLRGDTACGTRYFSVVHFRVQCRSSTGTTESTVTSLDLRALDHKELEWVVGPNRGKTTTDSDGYGKALVISNKSIAKKRFVLKAGKTALGLTAEDVSRIVVPSNWCN